MNDESRQTRRIDLLSPARWNGLAILGIVFVLLLLTEIALRSSLRRGWTNYTESESVSLLAVDSQGQAWAAVYDMNQYVRTDNIVMFPADEEPVHIPLPEALATDVVQFLKIDVEDRIWLGTVSGMLADEFMRAVFGEGWAFADALSFFVAPALRIGLVPLAVIAGAALGILLVRLAARIFPA